MENNYSITHIGKGEFQVKLEDGKIVNAGPRLCGMIRYTYFEDFTIPELGWSISNKQLLEDYFPKVQKDILNGKIL